MLFLPNWNSLKFVNSVKVTKSSHSDIVIGYHESESPSAMSNSLQTHGLYCPWNSPGQNIGVGSLSLLQNVFPTPKLNPGLLHCRWTLYQLDCKGSPRILGWIVFPFSNGSSQPRNPSRVSCIAGRLFTNWTISEALDYHNLLLFLIFK